MAALSSVLRRSASSMVPLALQTLRGQRYYRPLAFAAKIAHNHSPPPRFHFSSESSKLSSSDKSLLRVLDEEIKSARESDDHSLVEELPRGFPFEIQDNPGHRTVTLKRKYGDDEDVHVVVHMPSLVSGVGENDIDEDDNADEDAEKALQSSVPLVVNVSNKAKDPSLEFLCTAYVDEIVIESLAVKSSSGNAGGDQIAYEGPDFNDLDENLRKCFHKYLEIRGIKPSSTSFLHEYMIDKDNKEYLSWLQKVKKFIQA